MLKQYKQNWKNRIRHDFLLTFFNSGDYSHEKEVNGFFLIKQFNSEEGIWEVAIYTRESYKKRKAYKQRMTNLLIPRRNKQKRV